LGEKGKKKKRITAKEIFIIEKKRRIK